ncbi:MAG: YicC/YloC family endoribonuclease [Saccharofermentanales bacterium]
MLKSMTGYGEGLAAAADSMIRVECRSVNHRYLDISIRTPSRYSAVEPLIRTLAQKALGRGRVEIRVSDERGADQAAQVNLDDGLAKAYWKGLHRLEEITGMTSMDPVGFLATRPGIFTAGDTEEDQALLEERVSQALQAALEDLNQTRSAEGGRLAEDLAVKTRELKDLTAAMAARAPLIPEIYRERLLQRAEELLADHRPEWYDDQRLFAETALFADRASIDEEIIRLGAHLRALEETLESDQPVGRQLDFLIQELFREINTIGSKANDLELTQTVVAAKTLLEKIREQVQNIE